MGFKCGIVGLPNIGKSTLFNALTATSNAEASNYPFCTIDPNVGRIAVPDKRLEQISYYAKSNRIVPTYLEFVDIAGLIHGASKGEGLGNQFLGHIREVDAIIHVLRCFEGDKVIHFSGNVDPIRDAEIVNTELMLADLEVLEKYHQKLSKRICSQDKEEKKLLLLVDRLLSFLKNGQNIPVSDFSKEDMILIRQLQLLTTKPLFYVCNVGENDVVNGNQWTKAVEQYSSSQNTSNIVVSAAIEAEIASLESSIEKEQFLNALHLKETGLSQVIQTGYKVLNLITFFTAGPKETHAWTINDNTSAREAAGVIHSDFERGFICAETISYDDYILCKGEHNAKSSGKMRMEGRDYKVCDGDIFVFRFNV